MCSERDCSIFRGMLTACDGCERMSKSNGTPSQASLGAARLADPR